MNKKILIIVLLSMSNTACSSLNTVDIDTNQTKGRIMLAGDREGIRAFMDGLNGMIVTGKAKANTDDSYHQLRRAHDLTERKRFKVVIPGNKTIH